MSVKKRALGRGLDILIPEQEAEEPVVAQAAGAAPAATAENIVEAGAGKPRSVNINQLDPNPNQARRRFEEESLNELADSIRLYGIIEPIIVKESEGRYRIIAGERRYRAARLAKLKEVPVLLREAADEENEIVALIENIQRMDLNPVEQAHGVAALMDTYGYTQDAVSQKLGKSRSQIANLLRIRKLPEEVLRYVTEGRLSLGHAKIIAGLVSAEMQLALARKIVENDMNVRSAERLAQELSKPERGKVKVEKPVYIEDLEKRVEQVTGTKVNIVFGKKVSRIEIEFYNEDDLDRIIQAISAEETEE